MAQPAEPVVAVVLERAQVALTVPQRGAHAVGRVGESSRAGRRRSGAARDVLNTTIRGVGVSRGSGTAFSGRQRQRFADHATLAVETAVHDRHRSRLRRADAVGGHASRTPLARRLSVGGVSDAVDQPTRTFLARGTHEAPIAVVEQPFHPAERIGHLCEATQTVVLQRRDVRDIAAGAVDSRQVANGIMGERGRQCQPARTGIHHDCRGHITVGRVIGPNRGGGVGEPRDPVDFAAQQVERRPPGWSECGVRKRRLRTLQSRRRRRHRHRGRFPVSGVIGVVGPLAARIGGGRQPVEETLVGVDRRPHCQRTARLRSLHNAQHIVRAASFGTGTTRIIIDVLDAVALGEGDAHSPSGRIVFGARDPPQRVDGPHRQALRIEECDFPCSRRPFDLVSPSRREDVGHVAEIVGNSLQAAIASILDALHRRTWRDAVADARQPPRAVVLEKQSLQSIAERLEAAVVPVAIGDFTLRPRHIRKATVLERLPWMLRCLAVPHRADEDVGEWPGPAIAVGLVAPGASTQAPNLVPDPAPDKPLDVEGPADVHQPRDVFIPLPIPKHWRDSVHGSVGLARCVPLHFAAPPILLRHLPHRRGRLPAAQGPRCRPRSAGGTGPFALHLAGRFGGTLLPTDDVEAMLPVRFDLAAASPTVLRHNARTAWTLGHEERGAPFQCPPGWKSLQPERRDAGTRATRVHLDATDPIVGVVLQLQGVTDAVGHRCQKTADVSESGLHPVRQRVGLQFARRIECQPRSILGLVSERTAVEHQSSRTAAGRIVSAIRKAHENLGRCAHAHRSRRLVQVFRSPFRTDCRSDHVDQRFFGIGHQVQPDHVRYDVGHCVQRRACPQRTQPGFGHPNRAAEVVRPTASERTILVRRPGAVQALQRQPIGKLANANADIGERHGEIARGGIENPLEQRVWWKVGIWRKAPLPGARHFAADASNECCAAASGRRLEEANTLPFVDHHAAVGRDDDTPAGCDGGVEHVHVAVATEPGRSGRNQNRTDRGVVGRGSAQHRDASCHRLIQQADGRRSHRNRSQLLEHGRLQNAERELSSQGHGADRAAIARGDRGSAHGPIDECLATVHPDDADGVVPKRR